MRRWTGLEDFANHCKAGTTTRRRRRFSQVGKNMANASSK
jgi:hypothetical protein